jgi:hypothetical protein
VTGRIAVAALVAVVVIVSGCDAAAPSGASPASESVGPPASEPAFSFEPIASFGILPEPSGPDENTPTVIDASLLSILPATVDGIPVTEAVDEAANAILDPFLPTVASAVDAAVVADAGNGDLAYALVVRLRDGALTDTGFRDWRDTYDQGACDGAGGVAGHAQTTIAGQTVYIGTCAASIHTYHVWLADTNVLISAWSIGDRNLGEQLLAGLRPSGA